MEHQAGHSSQDQHLAVKATYDEAQSDGRYEEGMGRMAAYHRYCQDPVIFRALGDVRGKSLLDLACGDGFYTRRFRVECAAHPVMGIDLSPKQIERAQAIIRNLLEFSRTSGVEVERIDVNELLLRTVQLLQKYMQNNGVHVVTQLGSIPTCAANLTDTCYYDAENEAELSTALNGVIQQVASCRYDVPTSPEDPDRIYVYLEAVSGTDPERTRLERNISWSYDEDLRQIEFFDAACNQLKAGTVHPLIVFGCRDIGS